MMWRELLQTNDEAVVAPWVGGRSLRTGERTWTLEGDLPPEHGWYTFRASGRKLRAGDPAEAAPGVLRHPVRGYLVGDRLVPDDARVDPDPSKIVRASERVHLVEPGLDRFARVAAGRAGEGGSSRVPGAGDAPGARGGRPRGVPRPGPRSPACAGSPRARRGLPHGDLAEGRGRGVAAPRWSDARREEEERRAREERRKELAERLGDGAGRRAMVHWDFAEAARAALAVGGAEYLDHRRSSHRGVVVVRFRVQKQRFECTCDEATLRIIDAGICLVDHETGERGDTYFTLESLPAVILEARRGGQLVVFRHVE